jgi:hypothetical protein
MALKMNRTAFLWLIPLFFLVAGASKHDTPRLRLTKGAWSPQQVAQWGTRVTAWANQTESDIREWARAEGKDPKQFTKDLTILIRHTTALQKTPYSLYDMCIAREQLSEVKGEFAIMSDLNDSRSNRQFAARMYEAQKKARDFEDAMVDPGDALIKWYAANSPQPVW